MSEEFLRSYETDNMSKEPSEIVESTEPSDTEEDIRQTLPLKKRVKLRKRKKPSFTHQYFETMIEDNTEKTYCKIVDSNGNRCSQVYKNLGGSTGNLIAHLRDIHSIIDQDADESQAKKLRSTKITDYTKNIKPLPKRIQKKREEVILKWMLLTNKSLRTIIEPEYREKMAGFDPAFVVPGEQKIRTMIAKSYQYNQKNLQNLLTETVDYVSLTMDLWSSRAKHGYLGITANWITLDFGFKDVMLDIIYLPSPHTASVVAETLYNAINKWNLQYRVTSITTDNGSNMISAISILNTMHGYSNTKRLPCTAHTLQLVVGKGLLPIEIMVARARRLIQFFNTQKQIEYLEKVQKKLGYTEILHLVQDVSTRWNSTYSAWNRLFFLKDAIIQMQTDLCTSINRDEKKDGIKLKKMALTDEEWDLMDSLIDLLMPFEEITRELSGGTYVTLSKIIPVIKEFIFDYAPNSLPELEDINDNNLELYLEEEELQPIDSDDDTTISNYTKKKINIKNPLNTEGALDNVKNKIYNALIYYWNIPSNLGYMASLLDPRYKDLDFIEDEDEKNNLYQQLRDEYEALNSHNPISNFELSDIYSTSNFEPDIYSTSSQQETSNITRSHKEYMQQRKSKGKKKKNFNLSSKSNESDEVLHYLSFPSALGGENPLEWWKTHENIFPKLSKLAKKYLAVPGTSVSSERLFSDAGNLINTNRVRMDPELVKKRLFLKRNLKSMQVFAPEWDESS